MPYKVLSSQTAYRARVFDVQRDEIEMPDGHTAVYEIVVHIGAVAMVPVDADGKVYFVRQYRHTAGKRILEIPAGTLEKGEDPQDCAHRELQEEIGMAAARLTKLSDFFLAPGYSTERMHVYLAQDLSPSRLPGDEDEDIEVVAMTLDEAFAAIRNGEIEEAKTILALYLATEHLQKYG